MSYEFRPAATFTERSGLFVSVTGSTNSGKTFSALRLARGLAGRDGKIAVLDTEGGRTLHLKNDFVFDVHVMDPPFSPDRFAEFAKKAEEANYDALLIDSFSQEWAGLGGVLSWQEAELQRMAGDDFKKRERVKMASWIKPKTSHKQMVYSFLQRRMPIIFSIRGEQTMKPGEPGEKPQAVFRAITDSRFPFELTVAFRLAADRKGYIDLSDPTSWKMEGAHQSIFRDGDRLSEEHGAALSAWARGEAVGESAASFTALRSDGKAIRFPTIEAWAEWWAGPIAKATAAQLRALRSANGELMGEYAEEHGDAVIAVQERIRAALEAAPEPGFASAGEVAA